MIRILVTGGSGVLGRQVVSRLAESSTDAARVMSRQPRPAGVSAKMEWAQADLESGHGLREAVADVHTIIHAASNPLKRTHEVDVAGTRRLLAEARAAGAAHLLYVSIVGMEHVPYPYYRHKLAAEQLIAQGDVPWTILRATQFQVVSL